MTDLPFREKTNDRKVGAWLLLGLIVLLGAVYVAGYYFTGDRVPRGTTVAGVSIGGMRPVAAEQELAEGLASPTQQPIVVTAANQRSRILPEKAGLTVDLEQSVDQAGGGRSWNPARMWESLAGGGEDYEAVLAVDESRLEATVDRLADKVDQEPRKGRIAFDKGRVDARMPRTGIELDRDAATADIREAFLNQGELLTLEVSEVKADVTRDEVRAAMRDFANPAMSAPVIIELGGRNVVLRPRAYSAVLSMENQNGSLVPVLDEKALLKAMKPAMRQVSLVPVSATVKLVDGAPQVVKGKSGVTFDPKQFTDQFLSLVVQRGENRRMVVDAVEKKPDLTVADARNLQIKEVVSSFETSFPHADYRNTNLGRAAELISGTVLEPGETFSFNETVGERTAANGFTRGFIISDGVYKEDFGGGVSQVATTVFNAAFFAGLEDVEHKPHSFYIDRYPLGREATVVWGAVDLQFKNDTPYGVLIEAGIEPSSPSSSGEMWVRMWSTEHWKIEAGVSDRYDFTDFDTRYIEDEGCVPNQGYRGFDVNVFRYFYKPGSSDLVRKETMHTTYTPSDTVVCRAKPGA